MKYLRFTGNRKTGQVRYRSGTIVCRLDNPQTCLLEVGQDIDVHDAKRLLHDHSDLFADEAEWQKAQAKAARVAKAEAAKAEAARAKAKPKAANLSDLTVAKLKALAKKNKVDLGKATRKADIIKVLSAAV